MRLWKRKVPQAFSILKYFIFLNLKYRNSSIFTVLHAWLLRIIFKFISFTYLLQIHKKKSITQNKKNQILLLHHVSMMGTNKPCSIHKSHRHKFNIIKSKWWLQTTFVVFPKPPFSTNSLFKNKTLRRHLDFIANL